MKKIGKLMVFRLSKKEDDEVEALASATATKKADTLRGILSLYLGDPEELSAIFRERINLAVLMREDLPNHDMVRVGVTLPDAMKEDLDRLSDQTGSRIESLMSMMIGGYLGKLRQQ